MPHLRLFIAATAASVVVTPAAAKPTTFQMHNTTWVFVDPVAKVKARESIDADGKYIATALNGRDLDHGTVAMKGSKICFTSAMNSNGEECWTTHPTAIGHAMKTTSDKGHKLTVTRVKYIAQTMPK